MEGHLRDVGQRGEDLAQQYMQEKGYALLGRNVYNRWGEIDLVMQKRHTIVFVEVKTRTGYHKGRPSETISFYKLKHLRNTIRAYIIDKKLAHATCVLDIIGVVLNKDKSLKELRHYENIPFSLD